MKPDRGRRPRLRLRARAVGRLAVAQYAAAADGRGVETLGIASRLLPGCLHVGERGKGGLGVADRPYPAGTELRRQPPPARPERRDVQRDRVADIDQLELRIEGA